MASLTSYDMTILAGLRASVHAAGDAGTRSYYLDRYWDFAERARIRAGMPSGESWLMSARKSAFNQLDDISN